MPHVERDTESKPKRTLYEDDASLMQAWSEEGTALVRPWYGDDMSRPEIGLHSMCLVLLVSEEEEIGIDFFEHREKAYN